jgi:3-oxoacyl-[acyl-carrier-protein] synthase II
VTRAARRDIVVTGFGAVCALGDDCTQIWRAVVERRTGIAPIRRFATDGFTVHLGALVADDTNQPPQSPPSGGDLSRRFATQALREAIDAARIRTSDGNRVALVLGTGLADRDAFVHSIAEDVANATQIAGPRLTVSTACSSSTAAIGFARDLLALDVADIVIAGGTDVLTPEVFAGFHALGVLSPAPCAPFSTPVGTTLGEGAGFLVLEHHEGAEKRGAEVIAHLSGFGLSGDGWHETSPDPHGAGVERVTRAALRDAGVDADAVGYVNVHGSGTAANDLSEWLGVQRALGARAPKIPVSSTKAALGHAQGAAGALETIITLRAMQNGSVPPTLHFTNGRAQSPPDPVAELEMRMTTWDHAVKLNSAFGGSNAGLILSRSCGSARSVARRPVFIAGIGEVGPGGFDSQAFPCVSAEVPRSRRVAPFDIESIVPRADPRGLDPASRFLTAAAALALRDAGVAVTGSLRDRVGLVVGQLRGSPASIDAFQRSIDERGLIGLSPSAFARIVLNAAAGYCSKLLSLRGPLSAITTGAGSSLVAFVLAAELLATREDTELMVAGGCDEHRATVDEHTDEGAACAVLAANASPVEVSGWALAGPGQLAEAVARVSESVSSAKSLTVIRAEDMPGGLAASGGIAVAAAVRSIRRGAPQVLVTSAAGDSMCAAILLRQVEGHGH